MSKEVNFQLLQQMPDDVLRYIVSFTHQPQNEALLGQVRSYNKRRLNHKFKFDLSLDNPQFRRILFIFGAMGDNIAYGI